MNIMITWFTMGWFLLQIIMSKIQRRNGEAKIHNNSAPPFFTENEAVFLLNVIKPKMMKE